LSCQQYTKNIRDINNPANKIVFPTTSSSLKSVDAPVRISSVLFSWAFSFSVTPNVWDEGVAAAISNDLLEFESVLELDSFEDFSVFETGF
jgi:hypothetical protein